MAAPKGNTFGSKTQRLWADTLKRIAVQDPDALRRVARKVLEAAEAGESWAVQEIGNRLDGKPVQQVEMTGDFTNRLAHEYSNAELAQIAAGQEPGAERSSESLS